MTAHCAGLSRTHRGAQNDAPQAEKLQEPAAKAGLASSYSKGKTANAPPFPITPLVMSGGSLLYVHNQRVA